MSLVFKMYDPANPIAPVQPPPDMDKAVEAIVAGADPHLVSCYLMSGPQDASVFREECRALEARLIADIQANKITTQTAAVEFLAANGRKDFPAAKLIELLKIHVGTVAKPALWADVVTAAKAEPSAVEPVAVEK